MSTTTHPDVSLIWNMFPFNYPFMGMLLWFALGNSEDNAPKFGEWWNYSQYIAWGVYTVFELVLNTFFFPFYLLSLPLTDLWNLIPHVALLAAIINDILGYGEKNMTEDQFNMTIGSAVMMFTDSQFFMIPMMMGFIFVVGLFTVSLILLPVLGIFFVFNIPVFIFAGFFIFLATCTMLFAIGFVWVFFGIPLVSLLVVLAFLVPFIMWMSLPNQKNESFVNYLESVYTSFDTEDVRFNCEDNAGGACDGNY